MRKIFLLIMLLFSMCSCNIIEPSNISAFERMTIEDSYYYTYIVPNDKEVQRIDVQYYKFLLRKNHENTKIYLIAWDKIEDVDEWTFTIENVDFLFSCKINFLVYIFEKEIFISVEEAVNKKMFSQKEIIKGLKKLPEFVSYDYH